MLPQRVCQWLNRVLNTSNAVDDVMVHKVLLGDLLVHVGPNHHHSLGESGLHLVHLVDFRGSRVKPSLRVKELLRILVHVLLAVEMSRGLVIHLLNIGGVCSKSLGSGMAVIKPALHQLLVSLKLAFRLPQIIVFQLKLLLVWLFSW